MGANVLITTVLQAGIFLGNKVEMNKDWTSLDIVLNSTSTFSGISVESGVFVQCLSPFFKFVRYCIYTSLYVHHSSLFYCYSVQSC